MRRQLLLVTAVLCGACYEPPAPVASRFVKSVQVEAQQGATLSVTAADSPSLAGTTLVIDPGALAEDTTITLELGQAPIVSGTDVAPAGPVAVFGPDGLKFSKPAKLTLPLQLASDQQPSNVFVQVQEGSGARFMVPHDALELASSQVQLQISGFSSFQPGASHHPECAPADSLRVTSDNLTPLTSLQADYEGTLTASGGVAPYAWTLLSGALPGGLSLDSATGVVSGSPSQTLTPGNETLTIQVADSQGATATGDVDLRVVFDRFIISNLDLPDAVMGAEYLTDLSAKMTDGAPVDAPVTWSLVDGALPDGLVLERFGDSRTSMISGMPARAGCFPATIQAVDNNGREDQVRLKLRVYETACTSDDPCAG